ncbi:MAG TPA: flagellin [Terriglobales bacterium]|nr:flagellin [Terriglobales bacterium]
MSFSILNNIPALAAENQLNITNNNLEKTLDELSSGSRINTGADDAAGLAVANGLMANVTALTQSAQNASDGVGKLQVADGALAQVTTLLNRAVTLATESANGTLSNTERAPLQAEFASIQAEINRIGATTNFNGEQVFQNTNANTEVSGNTTALTSASSLGGSPLTQVSANNVATTDSLQAGTAGEWVSAAATYNVNSVISANSTIQFTITNPGTGGSSVYTYQTGGVASTVGAMLTDMQSKGFITGVAHGAGGQAALDIYANGRSVALTEDTNNNLGGAGTGSSANTGTAATLTIGNNNPFVYTTYAASAGGAVDTVQNLITAVNNDGRYTAAINSNNKLAIGYGSVQEPTTATTGPVTTDFGDGTEFGGFATTTGATKTLTVTPYGASSGTTFYDQGNLTVGALMSDLNAMGLSASLNGNGDLVIADPNNPNNAPALSGSMTGAGVLGTFAAGAQASVAGVTDIYLTDDSANPANTIAITVGSLSASYMNGASIASDNLSTSGAATTALSDISNAINAVAALRGTLGASVNRLQSAGNVINNDIQNLTSAENQIMAADIPSTVANMSQYSIMEQTGVAALAQANQMQQLVLKLLQ